MGKRDWAEIQLYIDAVKGLDAMAKLVNEKPFVSLSKRGQKLFEQVAKKHDDFYKLDIQERLYFSGMATRPSAGATAESPIPKEEHHD